MNARSEADQLRRLYDRTTPHYDRMIRWMERWLLVGGRRWVCRRAGRKVLEIAVGTGRNLPFYPRDVRLTGIDLSPQMLAVVRDRADDLALEADLRLGDAQALPFADGRFDTVVCTLGLCSIPDERQAVREAWRLLRPGGRLVLLEHACSPLRAVRIGQALLEPLFLCLQRDHLLREPADAVDCAAFVPRGARAAQAGHGRAALGAQAVPTRRVTGAVQRPRP